ncbi:MAG: hypothetical protein UY23_C0001G0079 [Candidatus Jorgensenbacteria bacterium GW2011_GWA1_48_11]|uniref:SGNH hydrolase-type esterase domain-containing protein n=1 Tax=Candidatus Jorgensenbacteria bacterium GW2011_GWA1_48_11 TaxID=1618660 RepID=A0A0G1WMA9_9BACT|nr:MAG: hypothetical protein UY23_C0001G0079 [Candidatus Jorgensenbacteria bacterium GW2011_GWA1_48_11]KKW11966.1 MAG: hypothetical protein UY51_C0005G0208 [Candidatus Jorgensenbacteria bacterium GW2011_GWB1_49_9]
MKDEVLKKAAISLIIFLLLLGLLEFGFRIRRSAIFRELPSAPDSAEGFGDLRGFLDYVKKLGDAQSFFYGTGAIYSPYTVTALKPNFGFKTKNIDYTTNSFGFRSKEMIVPKPKGDFRVFILGGSTVEGGFNEKWMISSYLEEELKKIIPSAEVINAGVVGYFSQQELALLETEISDLEPDLVIIFDGRNDLYYSILPDWKGRKNGDYFANQRILDSFVNYPSLRSLLAYDAKVLIKKSAFLTDLFRVAFRRHDFKVYPENARIKEAAIDLYLNNLKIEKEILDNKNIKGLFVFQPTLGYCKDNLSSYENSVLEYFRAVEKTNWIDQVKEYWPRVGKLMADIPDSQNVKISDLSCLFKDFKNTAYVDGVHYVPESYRLIAERLAKIIENNFLPKTL